MHVYSHFFLHERIYHSTKKQGAGWEHGREREAGLSLGIRISCSRHWETGFPQPYTGAFRVFVLF